MIYDERGLKGHKLTSWLQEFTCSARE